jgi:hypothetical protein
MWCVVSFCINDENEQAEVFGPYATQAAAQQKVVQRIKRIAEESECEEEDVTNEWNIYTVQMISN